MKKMKILDRYIITKFLSTFLFALGLIIVIAIVFDISEKIDDFIEKEAPFQAIVFDYYLNFIPYFVNLFSPLFVFIAVIFFTSKMAGQTEIVAILASGVSFRRFVAPYIVVAAVIAAASFYLNGWVIPHANKTRLEFENTYIKNPYVFKSKNIHRQIVPGEFIYFESYNNIDNIGYRFTYEKFNGGALNYKMHAERLKWNETDESWKAENFSVRPVNGMDESLQHGQTLDTTFNFTPDEFNQRENNIVTLDMKELEEHIQAKKIRGAEGIQFDLVEKYKRSAFPFATFILTMIGVSLSSRKVRGGIGLQIGIGLLLSFSYIMFMQITTTFATNGNMPAVIAVWIPNLIYAGVAIYLLRSAPK